MKQVLDNLMDNALRFARSRIQAFNVTNQKIQETRRRVLIIDDEEDLVEMLALRLESSGLFVIDKAFDGPSGLEKAKSFQPDVVLLDTIMPRMDGWEVCRRLRSDPRTAEVGIVVMTAGTAQDCTQLAKEAKADRLIFKPYEHKEVLEALESVGNGKRSND